jgi:hypothetical protein
MGLDHQPTARLSSPVAAIAIAPQTRSLVTSHRVRLTVWFQTSLWVPAASSEEISGAPQNAPISGGTTRTATHPTSYRALSAESPWVRLRKPLPAVAARCASAGPVIASRAASRSSTA